MYVNIYEYDAVRVLYNNNEMHLRLRESLGSVLTATQRNTKVDHATQSAKTHLTTTPAENSKTNLTRTSAERSRTGLKMTNSWPPPSTWTSGTASKPPHRCDLSAEQHVSWEASVPLNPTWRHLDRSTGASPSEPVSNRSPRMQKETCWNTSETKQNKTQTCAYRACEVFLPWYSSLTVECAVCCCIHYVS